MEKFPTIEELRKSGYKVRVSHLILNEFDPYFHLAKRGTRIDIRDLNENEFTGYARCSMQDQYDRKVGNKVALGRALKNMQRFYDNKPLDNVPEIL